MQFLLNDFCFSLGIILFYISALINPVISLPSIEKQEDWLYYSAAEPETTFDSNYVNFCLIFLPMKIW